MATVALLFLVSFVEGKEMDDCVRHSGMCAASAAVALDDETFVVADDERNTLCIYRADRPGPPVWTIPWDAYLGVGRDEADIEGGTVLNGRVYWISSHARDKHGKWRRERHRFFAMEIHRTAAGWSVVPFGRCTDELAVRLVDAPSMRELDLDKTLQPDDGKAKKLAPDKKGFNIEGLCAAADSGTLLIALRNPRPQGKALLAPLINPEEVLTGGDTPRFGEPILLDLSFEYHGKQVEPGIRGMTWSPREKAYLIIAGSHDGKGAYAVFQWSGIPTDKPRLLPEATEAIRTPKDFGPEAIVVYPQSGEVQVFSDDGSLDVDVDSPAECKRGAFKNGKCNAGDLLDPRKKFFRSMFLPIP